jgi:hypothetical protein
MQFDAVPLSADALDAIRVLEGAQAFLRANGWCRGTMYRNGNIESTGEHATKACAIGSMQLAGGSAVAEAALARCIIPMRVALPRPPKHTIMDWNDRAGNSKRKVIATMGEAIDLLRSGWLP